MAIGGVLGLAILSHAAPPAGSFEPKLSRDDTDVSPDGRVTFHGPFFNEGVTATCDALPAHDFVRVECELLILRTWDGSVPFPISQTTGDGPDEFRLSVPGGPVLLSTTFSNLPDRPRGFHEHGKKQNYPSPVPGDLLPAWTGSAEQNTMGYHYPKPGPPQLVPMDATYRLVLLLPHQGASLTLKLEAMGLKSLLDESWGVKSLTVTPLVADAVTRPDDAAIASAFATALDATTTTQPDAVNTLVIGTDRTVAWIKANVQPSPVDAAAVAGAIAELSGDDTRIAERDGAEEKLPGFGIAAEPYLRDARLAARGEARVRIEQVLSRLSTAPITDDATRRVALATRVLEVIATPEAAELRRALVGSK
jgi:hypothetical protein